MDTYVVATITKWITLFKKEKSKENQQKDNSILKKKSKSLS